MIINLGCGNETYGDIRVDFRKTKTTTHICDLNKRLPFKDEQFDVVYSKSVLEHIKNVGTFTKECLRICKKGGCIFILTDNASYLPFHLRSHQDYINYPTSKEDKHYYLFKPEHLINLFGNNIDIKYSYPSKKLFFLPKKFKCMHIEITEIKQ